MPLQYRRRLPKTFSVQDTGTPADFAAERCAPLDPAAPTEPTELPDIREESNLSPAVGGDRRSAERMRNLLLEEVEFQVRHTRRGVWRRFVYPSGEYFAEFRSHASIGGLPLIHYTRGRNPETGRRVVAKGVLAVGRLALGVVAIGHASAGVVAVGQASAGLLLGLGQGTAGLLALGQIALGLELGIGQIATGETAVAQLGIGHYVLAQVGWGEHLWTPERADPEAVAHFRGLWQSVKDWLEMFPRPR